MIKVKPRILIDKEWTYLYENCIYDYHKDGIIKELSAQGLFPLEDVFVLEDETYKFFTNPMYVHAVGSYDHYDEKEKAFYYDINLPNTVNPRTIRFAGLIFDVERQKIAYMRLVANKFGDIFYEMNRSLFETPDERGYVAPGSADEEE